MEEKTFLIETLRKENRTLQTKFSDTRCQLYEALDSCKKKKIKLELDTSQELLAAFTSEEKKS